MKNHRLLAIVLVAGLGLTAAACSESAEDFSDEDLRSELIDVLSEGDALEPAQAECTIDFLFENLSREDLNQLANAQEETDASPEQVAALQEGVVACLTPAE